MKHIISFGLTAGNYVGYWFGQKSGQDYRQRKLINIHLNYCMKYLFFVFICAIITISCRKGDNLRTSNNGTRLMAVSNDSAGTWKFGYTDNSITSIARDSNRTIHSFIDYLQYTTINSVQYVTLTSVQDTFNYSESYTLTSSKLPLSIDAMYTINGVKHTTNVAKFFYQQNTDLLDSVLYHPGSSLFVFKVIYTGKNITEITENQISNNQSAVINTFNFTYGTTPNVFLNTDSLLYIYTYPHTALFAQPMVIAAFFAETFSASTFDSITTSGITNAGWNQVTISSRMMYTLNADGKITEEAFNNNIFEFLAGKKYYYQ